MEQTAGRCSTRNLCFSETNFSCPFMLYYFFSILMNTTHSSFLSLLWLVFTSPDSCETRDGKMNFIDRNALIYCLQFTSTGQNEPV
jgi:hypothetical protein